MDHLYRFTKIGGGLSKNIHLISCNFFSFPINLLRKPLLSGVSIFQEEIFFVTGKGGVGKSSVAAAIAHKLANSSNDVKLVDLDQYFRTMFERDKQIDFSIEEWTGMKCLSEYVDHLVKLRGLGKLFFDNPVMSKLLNIAPGLFELAILGKLSSKQRDHGPPLDYDKMVLDSYATGHSLSMLKAPFVMAESITRGPMHVQSQGIISVLKSDVFQPVVVVTPELMAVEESIELATEIEKMLGKKSLFVINRIYKEFEDLPNLENPWEKFLFQKKNELDKVRELLKTKGFQFLESPLITNAENSIDLVEKMGAQWKIS